jgi:transposase-like protein
MMGSTGVSKIKQKRSRFSAQFEFETVMEALRGENSVSQVCREREITETLYYKWRDAFFERALGIFEDGRSSAHVQQSEHVAELERMVGRLTMENAVVKEAGSLLDTTRGRNGR